MSRNTSRNTWRQDGDFSTYYGRNIPEGDARNIKFINIANNAIIKMITFVGCVNGSFYFFIESDNNLDRTNIFRAEIRRLSLPYMDAMVQYNIERNDLDFYENGIAYSSPNFCTMDDPIFLNVMTLIHNLEPSFESEMKDVVIGLINQYSNQQGTQSRQGRHDSENGERVFINPLMFLRFMLSLSVNTASSARVLASHLLTGPGTTEETENHGGALVVRTENLPASHVPLRLERTGTNLTLMDSLNRFREPLYPNPQSRMQHRLADPADPMTMQQFINQTIFDVIPRPPVQIPKEGVNAKALSELDDFDTASIPSHFICPLSGDIMDNPVIDPTTLNTGRTNIDDVTRVDRPWLERVISESNGKSPFTRQPVVSPLIPDAQRKTDIENFVQEQVSRYSSAPLKSSLKPAV